MNYSETMTAGIIREKITRTGLLVVKVGTSSLSFSSGGLNFQWMSQLAEVLSQIRLEGRQVILVSSGAVGIGAGRLGVRARPGRLDDRQALAAVGQAELIRIYQKFFGEHGQTVAQVLLTRDSMEDETRRYNARNTLLTLLSMDIIPIINENDTVSTTGIEFGDNDTLSARVAELTGADLLILLSDIEGLFTADPRRQPEARFIPYVKEITAELLNSAEGSGSSFGTGGMQTKLSAAGICLKAGTGMIIAHGRDPNIILKILEGKEVGTYFTGG